MSRVADIRHLVDDYRSTELLTGALQDISVSHMQALRKDFEQNALFFAGIREVYGIVKAHAGARVKSPDEKPAAKNKRNIYVALTSNKRFYGNLNRDIMNSFIHVTESVTESDFLVVGQTGAQFLDAVGYRRRVTRTEFTDDAPSTHEIQSVLSLTDSYERVFMIYPKFVNTFRQEVAMTDITQTPEDVVSQDMMAEYIFEPEIPVMITFFEAQVRRALFERVMLEADLARTAARAIKMRDARDRAGDMRAKYERTLLREIATVADLELMETFIGFNFWKQ